jgi:pyridoxamine 5'-phosphate oxidase
MTDFHQMRREYEDGQGFTKDQAGSDPIALFDRWFQQAVDANQGAWFEPNAMVLATADEQGPDGRIVLLKDFDEAGFVFYTNYASAKARQMSQRPRASLVFYWSQLHRQVRISGRVEKVDEQTSKRYFASRPRGSQLGAVVSRQSEVIRDRKDLESRLERARREYEDKEIPMPENWGGYRVVPDRMEFWSGRENRLHDRIRFRIESGSWICERLSP